MKRLALFLLMIAAAIAANGQTIVGSKHDLRRIGGGTPVGHPLGEVCVVCHTMHQATASATQPPLWNRGLSGQGTYGTYTSKTLNASPTDAGGATLGSAATTNLCLSCHDGTVSVLSMLNPPPGPVPGVVPIPGRIDSAGRIISSSNMGISLADDHPVNFTYDSALATSDGGLQDPAADPAVSRLLHNGTVQCTSCHDVHDPTYAPFLVMSNDASALCKTCHLK